MSHVLERTLQTIFNQYLIEFWTACRLESMNLDNAYYKSNYSGKLIPVRVVSMASGELKLDVVLDWTRTRAQSYEHCEAIFKDFVLSVAGDSKDFSFNSDRYAPFSIWWGDLVDSENNWITTEPENKEQSNTPPEDDSNLELLRDVLSKLASAGYTVQDFDMNVAQGEVTLSATLKKGKDIA